MTVPKDVIQFAPLVNLGYGIFSQLHLPKIHLFPTSEHARLLARVLRLRSQDLESSNEDEPGTGYRRNSSTRYDTLDDTAQAPQQIQAGVPPIAPAAPPNTTATPPRSPLPYQLRSGRTHKGAPKKKRGGTRGRR